MAREISQYQHAVQQLLRAVGVDPAVAIDNDNFGIEAASDGAVVIHFDELTGPFTVDGYPRVHRTIRLRVEADQ